METQANTVLKVSLARPRERGGAPPALDTRGARVILGTQHPGLAEPVRPAPHTLFGPRGAAVTADGALWVADTGHHRLLGWPALPQADGAPADWLIGQPHFEAEGRNARGEVGGATLNVPTGLAACGEGLAVADAWNHRVLIWHRAPSASHEPADTVLGQPDLRGCGINRDRNTPSADTLYWPYGVHWDGAWLWVADTGNRRVLGFDGLPRRHGTPADLVLGQPDFGHRDENAGAVGAGSLRWPHAIARWHDLLAVADAGNNRVLTWRLRPGRMPTIADTILGQSHPLAIDHNRGEYWPGANSLNMPYGMAEHRGRLLVADTANSRLLRFDDPSESDARALAGQVGFTDKGDNRWRPPARDSLCWPYGLAIAGDACVVADSGNNRVLLWDLLP